MPDLELVAEGLAFPEGPVAMADGSVLLVEVARATVSRVSAAGEVTVVAQTGGGPNGLAIGPDGALYICNNGGRYRYVRRDGLLTPAGMPSDHAGGSIQRLDLDTGALTTLYEHSAALPILAPNDLVFDAHGGFWFTDLGTEDEEGTRHGALFHALADGSGITRAVRLRTPNGVGLSPDGRVLYVADTMSGRLWAFDLVAAGRIAPPASPIMPGRVVQTLPGFQLVDSLAVEEDGRVCVATIINGGITTFSPDGSFEHLAVPDRIVTNICFGGPDRRDAWITASSTGRVYRTRWPRPGLALSYAR